jgi:preprotein translocase subunit SecG
LITVLYVLLILTCIVLIVSVLLQPGKADAGALFSSAISSTAFGPRGTQTLLAKITIGAAAAFMLIAIALSLASDRRQSSVFQSESGEQQQQAQPTPQASPGASPAAPVQEGTANTGATGNTSAPVETTAPTSPATGTDTGSAPQPAPSQ